MSISVNGQSQVPPGFRFHPTEEELLQYYLRKKVASEEIDLDVIRDVDLNKLEPWDIQEMCKIGSTPQNDWYFFSHKDKKYPTGTRTNRATAVGFWKATGRDKVIYSESTRIGMRKTLVFYKGRAPHGQKSDWIMHEYRLDDIDTNNVCNIVMGEAMQEEGWVVCRVFKKKNHCSNKTYGGSPTSTTSPIAGISSSSCDEGTLEQILQSFRQNQQLPLDDDINRRFFKLPSLQEEIPNCSSSRAQPLILGEEIEDPGPLYQPESFKDWAALDRLVASHLNGQNDTSKQLSGFNHDDDDDDHDSGMTTTLCCPVDHQLIQLQHQKSLSSSSIRSYGANQDYQNDCDLWSFAPSSNDQLCHMSN